MKYIKYIEDFLSEQREVLLAPNGKPSNLNKVQYNIVRTMLFKDWFGDWENGTGSKVLDENGEPLVVYHGTDDNVEFYEFSENRKGFGKGIYFTSDKDYAKQIYGNKLIYVFLKAKKLKDIGSKVSVILQNQVDKWKEDGVDGVYWKDDEYDGGFREIVVFDANQIKLADARNIKFSNSNDIRENLSVVGYRNIHSNSVGKWGTFYNVRRSVHYDSNRVELTFNNPLVIRDPDIYNFEGLSLEYLFWKWFPDLGDTYKIMAEKEGIDSGELIDKLVTDEAIKRGYDGIIMGDLEVIDLRTHKNFKK